MSDIQKLIAEGQQAFAPMEHPILLTFLQQVQMTIEIVMQAKATKQLPIYDIRVLLLIYSFWTENGLLPQDSHADNTVTLLDTADRFLTSE